MHINIKFINIIILLIFLTYTRGFFNPTKCIGKLVDYIKQDCEVFQVVIIQHESISGEIASIANEIVSEIAGSVPTKVINSTELNSTEVLDLVKAGNITELRTTTLFVTIQILNSKQYYHRTNEIKKTLNQLIGKKGRPKCLVIFSSEEKRSSYVSFLQSLWLINFLDVNVFEYVDQKVSKENWFTIDHRHIATVHQFNPFTRMYMKEQCTAKTHFFYDNLRDLNGYKLKTGSFDEPPIIRVRRNRSGYPIEVTGAGALVVKALSNAMNCSILEIESKNEGWGDFKRDLSQNSTLSYKITHKKMQFYTNFAEYVIKGKMIIDYSMAIGQFCYRPVVPIFEYKTVSVQYSSQCFYMAVSMFLMMLIPFVVGYIFRSESSVWSPLYILEAALGFTIPPMPEKLVEQIIFVFELFAFLISASVIHAVLTGIKFTTEYGMEINTLEDLNNSRLLLVMSNNLLSVMRGTENDEITDVLLNKTIISSSDRNCIELLMKHRNISCIMEQRVATFYAQKYDKLRASFRIGKNCLRKGLHAMVLEPGSPYIRRIDQILAHLIQSGLVGKWVNDHSVNSSSNSTNHLIQDFSQTTNIMIPLVLTMSVGFSISVIVFASELMLHYLLKFLNKYIY